MKSVLTTILCGVTVFTVASSNAAAESRSVTMKPIRISALRAECAPPSDFTLSFTKTRKRVQLKDRKTALRKGRASMTIRHLGPDGIAREFVTRFSARKVTVSELGAELFGDGSCAFKFEGTL